jgi:ABC-type lipoprotein export system ATPase subunit
MAVLVVNHLIKAHAGTPVLHGVSLTLAHAERVALLGPSGCGKSTLLNCIGGVDRPDSGTVQLGDDDLTKLTPDALADVRKRSLGTVFQFFHLLPTLSAGENMELPLKLLSVPSAERKDRVQTLLDRVGLQHRAHALPGEMSGGEMQRVAIARALIHRPRLLLADEPTGNLDSEAGRRVLDLLRELSEEHQTSLLMVTHSEEAAATCHRVLRMRDGRISDA